jgi:hypothetical protein
MEGAILATMRRRGAAMLGRVCAGLAALCALAASPALAQTTATAESQVAIHEPLSILAVQDMDFGQIVTDGSPGTVTIVPNATQTCTVTGTLVRTGACRAAIFSGYAGWLSRVRIERMPGNQIVLTGPGGATMTVDNLTYATDATLGWQSGSGPTYVEYLELLDHMYVIRVGGRLVVGTNQPPGVYTGTITAHLNYT